MIFDKYPFQLKPLAYDYSAMEPYIDTATMHFHYDKHFQTYVDNLNKSLAAYSDFQSWPLLKLVSEYDKLPVELQKLVRNNAGGVYNHNLYFEIMTPKGSNVPVETLKNIIDKKFGNYANFKIEFKNVALGTFGSGYAYLASDKNGKINIKSVANQDTLFLKNLTPVLLMDVWEHGYYLKYQNKRAEYIDNWFEVINWEIAENKYNSIINL